LDSSNNQVYIGGSFTSIQNQNNPNNAKNIAKWSIANERWSNLGNNSYNGVNDIVNSITLDSSKSNLYVGGSFFQVYDPSNISQLGNNIAQVVLYR